MAGDFDISKLYEFKPLNAPEQAAPTIDVHVKENMVLITGIKELSEFDAELQKSLKLLEAISIRDNVILTLASPAELAGIIKLLDSLGLANDETKAWIGVVEAKMAANDDAYPTHTNSPMTNNIHNPNSSTFVPSWRLEELQKAKPAPQPEPAPPPTLEADDEAGISNTRSGPRPSPSY